MDSINSMDKQFIQKITQVIENNLHDEKFGVSELARELGMSRATLHRKVKNIIKKSISDFIRETRLKKAFGLLKSQSGTASEIAYKVGFNSATYFNKCFHEFYGITPGEVLKGNYAKANKTNDEKRFFPAFNRSKIRLLYISFLGLLSVILYFVFILNNSENEKTIAVLPPFDKSIKQNECILLEGLYESIESNLTKIHDLNLKSSILTNFYRNSEVNLQTIAKELRVNYLVKITGQTVDSASTVWIEFIDIKAGDQIFKETYTFFDEFEKIHEAQQEISLLIAEKLNIEISKFEMEEIQELPTENKAAYNFYQMALMDGKKFAYSRNDDDLFSTKRNLEKAINLDSSFAQPYLLLADIYINQLPFKFIRYDEEASKYNELLDSGLILLNKAIKIGLTDSKKALKLKANYFHNKGQYSEAIQEFEKIWKDEKKDFRYYELKMPFYYRSDDYYNVIKHALLYLKSKPTSAVLNQNRLMNLLYKLAMTGFPKLAQKYNRDWYDIHNDSLLFKTTKRGIYINSCEITEAIKLNEHLCSLDSANEECLRNLWVLPYHLRDFETAFKNALLYEKKMLELYGDTIYNVQIGSLYFNKGLIEKANQHIQGDLENCIEYINQNIPYAQRKWVHGRLAAIYAMQNKNEEALEQLSIMASRNTMNRLVPFQIKQMLMYDNLHDEPEFQKILNELDRKYLKEHEKVKKLLIKEGLVPE